MSENMNADNDRKYPIDPNDPIGSRAHDELMRVTGMGRYAESMRGGPPGKVRATIPAQPEYDTDCIIEAALAERDALRAERDAAEGALKGVSGALMDAATIPVPSDEMGYGDAVRALTGERDGLREEVGRLRGALLEALDELAQHGGASDVLAARTDILLAPAAEEPRAPLHVPREDTKNDLDWATYAALMNPKPPEGEPAEGFEDECGERGPHGPWCPESSHPAPAREEGVECNGEALCPGQSDEFDDWCQPCKIAWLLNENGGLEREIADLRESRPSPESRSHEWARDRNLAILKADGWTSPNFAAPSPMLNHPDLPGLTCDAWTAFEHRLAQLKSRTSPESGAKS